jgi:hypothetical protein
MFIMPIWWMTPLQCFATLGGTVSFGSYELHTNDDVWVSRILKAWFADRRHKLGGGIMQSLLSIPILHNPQLPLQHVTMQTRELLERSEPFFRPLNMACEFSNLICIITAFLNRKTSTSAAKNLPLLGIAWAICLMLTASLCSGSDVALERTIEMHSEGVRKGF